MALQYDADNDDTIILYTAATHDAGRTSVKYQEEHALEQWISSNRFTRASFCSTLTLHTSKPEQTFYLVESPKPLKYF